MILPPSQTTRTHTHTHYYEVHIKFLSFIVHLLQKTVHNPNLHHVFFKKLKIERQQHTIKYHYYLSLLYRQQHTMQYHYYLSLLYRQQHTMQYHHYLSLIYR